MTVLERRGWLFKGTDLSSGVASRRYGKLGGGYFYTFGGEDHAKPSGFWALHPECEVTPLEAKEITVRKRGKALVTRKSEKLKGFCFAVQWPSGTQSKIGPVFLGFETESLAAQWQTSFLHMIQSLGMVAVNSTHQDVMQVDSTTVTTIDSDAESQASESFCRIERPSGVVEENTYGDHDTGFSTKVEPGRDTPKSMYSREMRIDSSATATSSYQDHGASNEGESSGYWCPWKHVNGVAVYREDVQRNMDGAFMVSCIIRAPPPMCFSGLTSRSSAKHKSPTGFLDMEVLEELSNDMQVVHARIEAMGWVGQFYAPREVVAERSWRLEEEDGTYVVLLQSTDKYVTESEQTTPLGPLAWLQSPVRAQVKAAGFTIAPLQEKYCADPTKSPESLVTMVLKIDLGGTCGSESWLRPLSYLTGAQEAWIECMLMTVVCLRDRVEQSRFVTLPFSIGNSSSSYKRHSLSVQSIRGGKNEANGTRPPEADTQLDSYSRKTVSQPVPLLVPSDWEKGTLNPKYWSCPGAAGFKVRGKNYLTDRKKIEAGPPEFELRSVDLVRMDEPTPHVARYLKSIRCSTAGFTFVLQIMVPGPPHLGLVIAWASKDNSVVNPDTLSSGSHKDLDLDGEPSPFELALMRFVDGDDPRRNDMFKLIPHIVKGSWIIRQSVGATPVLLGHKLKQFYHRGPRYIEVDVNVGSSYTAASVVGLVSNATKSLCVDLAIVMEGRSLDELPEALLGTVRCDKVDLGEAVYLDTTHEIPMSECSSPFGNGEMKQSPSTQS